MSLLEEMKNNRDKATSVTEDEVKKVVEEIGNAFLEWQQLDIDRTNFKMYANWNNSNILELEPEKSETTNDPITGEIKSKKYPVTGEIKSKKKQQTMLDSIEKILEKEGMKLDRNDKTRNASGEISFTIDVL